MLSGKPASIAAICAEPKLATRRAEDPKPEKRKVGKEFLSTLENKRTTDTAKRCLEEWKVDNRTWNSSYDGSPKLILDWHSKV